MHIILTTGRKVELTQAQVYRFMERAGLTPALLAHPHPGVHGAPLWGECLPWGYVLDRDGYPQSKVKRDKVESILGAHRLAYVIRWGQVPAGLQLDHLCRVRSCVNPYHLEPVTSAVNTERGDGPAVSNARKTHCKRGHELSGANLKISKGRGRACRECHRQGCRRYRAGTRTR